MNLVLPALRYVKGYPRVIGQPIRDISQEKTDSP